MVVITDMLLTNPLNRPALRPNKGVNYRLKELFGLVIHWTANTSRGADADNNRNFFNNRKDFGSAHYIVDDRQIVCCVPENEVAFHVGDVPRRNRNLPVRDKILQAAAVKNPNYATIGIEMCVNADGDWGKTYATTVSLAAEILYRHGKNTDILCRHWDITGKDCPRMFIPIGDDASGQRQWEKFIMDVSAALDTLRQPPQPVPSAGEEKLPQPVVVDDVPTNSPRRKGCLFFWMPR